MQVCHYGCSTGLLLSPRPGGVRWPSQAVFGDSSLCHVCVMPYGNHLFTSLHASLENELLPEDAVSFISEFLATGSVQGPSKRSVTSC